MARRRSASVLNRSSQLYKNALTAGALVLLACVLVGVILLNSAANEIRSVETKQTDTRAALVRSDLENQLVLMGEAAARLANQAIYLPIFRRGDPLKEVDLAGDLIKYERVSQLAEKCFLLYRDENMVYKPYAKQYFSVCMNLLGVSDHEGVYAEITAAADTVVIVPEDNEHVIFVCPVYFGNVRSKLPGAFLCYISDRQTLTRRVNDVSGGFDGSWIISFGGKAVASDGELPEGASFPFSPGIAFTLYRISERLDRFMALNIGLIAVVCALLFIIAAFLSYRSWLPIRRIVEKYSRENGSNIRNELEYIDRLIEEGHQRQKDLRGSIDRQRSLIARQLLGAIFRGERPEKSVVEDIFPYDSFGLITVSFPELPENAEALVSAIEALSDENTAFYCVRLLSRRCLVCVVCFQGGRRVQEARELVAASVDTYRSDYSIGSSAIRDMPEDIPRALMDALDGENAEGAEESSREYALDNSLIMQIVTETRSGDKQNACGYLQRYVELAFSAGRLARLLCDELLCYLLRLAAELNCPVDEGYFRLISEMTDREAVYSAVSSLVGTLCDTVAQRRFRNRSDQFDAILAYIDEHALDYDLDQDRVAERFGISSSSLYRMFKTIRGDSYKHYVTNLRVSRACVYLDQGLPVQEVCGMVGYNNVSYFIKAFKNITGYTPNSYKIRKQAGPPSDEQSAL